MISQLLMVLDVLIIEEMAFWLDHVPISLGAAEVKESWFAASAIIFGTLPAAYL